jgi:uncharacterized protein
VAPIESEMQLQDATKPLPWSSLDVLVDAVTERATNLGSRIHGPEHWHSVALASLHLLAAGEPADRPLVFLFAMLHDAMREDDGYDFGHGPRAAALADELRERGLLVLSDVRAARLHEALHDHTSGATSEDPTIGLCWDSDRLDLGRVGISPNPAFFSTGTARRLAAAALRLRWAAGAPDWQSLAARFAGYSPRRVRDL